MPRWFYQLIGFAILPIVPWAVIFWWFGWTGVLCVALAAFLCGLAIIGPFRLELGCADMRNEQGGGD